MFSLSYVEREVSATDVREHYAHTRKLRDRNWFIPVRGKTRSQPRSLGAESAQQCKQL